jgi:hypothetical protein
MDIINENINLEKMYEYQLKEKNNEEYDKYIKYLSTFFQKDDKKSKYNKEYIDGNYILIDKNNPKKKIIITPAQFININELYVELKDKINKILYKISSFIYSKNNIKNENRIEFDELKKYYKLFNEKIKEIDIIHKNYYNEIFVLLNDKIELTNKLTKYYKLRHEIYETIEIMIPELCKNKMIKLFKENKKQIPSLMILNKIAKEYDIPSKEIEKWAKWIENVYYYMYSLLEINKINKIIMEKEKEFLNTMNYMIIKKANIQD